MHRGNGIRERSYLITPAVGKTRRKTREHLARVTHSRTRIQDTMPTKALKLYKPENGTTTICDFIPKITFFLHPTIFFKVDTLFFKTNSTARCKLALAEKPPRRESNPVINFRRVYIKTAPTRKKEDKNHRNIRNEHWKWVIKVHLVEKDGTGEDDPGGLNFR